MYRWKRHRLSGDMSRAKPAVRVGFGAPSSADARRIGAAIATLAATGVVVFASMVPGPKPQAKLASLDFDRQVRPLLGDHCLACHGVDEKARQAGLRLDMPLPPKQLATLRQRLALKPGAPGAMPPPSHPKQPSAAARATLARWAADGAKIKTHWAFVPPTRPALPAVRDTRWTRNPIDRFVLARLEKEGIAPSPEAPKTTLLRRVALDLTGLPPTPAEMDAFLADKRPDAYERAVDRLLASPRYGEKMAQAWLDGARYADSNGYQADYERFQWPWRDWVIDAFNKNMPFDQFTIEQLAGDMLPNATLSQRVATGFNRNHRINTEGGVIAEEWRVENVVDRLETTGAVWLALSIGCGRCHDHKYDPISQRDFYRLFHYFNNVPESGTGAESPVNHPPLARVPGPDQAKALAAADRERVAATARLQASDQGLAARMAAWEERTGGVIPGTAWANPTPSVASRTGSPLKTAPDSTIQVGATSTDKETFTVTLPAQPSPLTGIRLEVFPDENGRISRHEGGNFVLGTITLTIDGKTVPLARATSDFNQDGFPVSGALDNDPNTGWGVYGRTDQPHTAVFSLASPTAASGPVEVRLSCESLYERHYFTKFRVSVTGSEDPHGDPVPADAVEALRVPKSSRTVLQNDAILRWFRTRDSETVAAIQAVRDSDKARQAVVDSSPTVMVMDEMSAPRKCYVLIRGQYDQRGDEVGPGIPPSLGKLPAGAPNNRLGFARWVASPTNPLTARVAVNRLWEKFFGTGIVATSEDFGVRAELPSHPELLDWLAVEFVRLGWDLKAIQKLMVTSAAYRQSSAVRPDLLRRDPENRLCARMPRLRLPAEVIRDQALHAAGLLKEKIGGPGVRPYQPDGVWDEINVYGNLRNYKHDRGDNLYRRSLYTFWKRTAAPPQMAIFDVPGREACRVRRSRTNTPLQALVLMNDPTFVEAARILAARAMRDGGTDTGRRMDAMFRHALGRRPTLAERWVLEDGLRARVDNFRKRPDDARKLLAVGETRVDPGADPGELAAWTLLAGIVLNTDEMVTRE